MTKRMRAIDFYSGIGGWTLGLRLAGIDVVSAYEFWDAARETYKANLSSESVKVDLRRLKLKSLPKRVDIVVGSPPCTQFSYSNRGGNGDIEDGLKDIARFLSIVKFCKPKYWVMENVPRLKDILETELYSPKGRLRSFAGLFDDSEVKIEVVDMADFGLPQNRKRCIAGRIPFDLLHSYSTYCTYRTLGKVITSLGKSTVTDAAYGIQLSKTKVTDHLLEKPLTKEEKRLNRDAKVYHPVYNKMSFPDRFDRPARTVTATCTRVSRESIIIKGVKKKDQYRRLTIRERAVLQGFPITYQFFGTAGQKFKVIGNAIPPLFTFYVGSAMRGRSVTSLKHPWELKKKFPLPRKLAQSSPTDTLRSVFLPKRRFRATIPNLRFGSGVRFELANKITSKRTVRWEVSFLYGTPQDIRTLKLNAKLLKRLHRGKTYKILKKQFERETTRLGKLINQEALDSLQKIWTHKLKGRPRPYEIVDELGRTAKHLIRRIRNMDETVYTEVQKILKFKSVEVGGKRKIRDAASAVYIGFLLGSWTNMNLSR